MRTALANADPVRRAQIILWPRKTRQSPAYWCAFCATWKDAMGVPAGLSPSTAAAVLYAITSAMSADESNQQYVCFLSYNTIAERAHVERKSVQRVIAWQKDSTWPLIVSNRVAATKGVRHASYRFTLISDPVEFVRARDKARQQKVDEFRKAYKQAAPAVVELQKAKITDMVSAPSSLPASTRSWTRRADDCPSMRPADRLKRAVPCDGVDSMSHRDSVGVSEPVAAAPSW